ncbi:MAG: ABC transporter permease [Lachnospiraceae bacterium]|nr:ABC transporter permease [Lachnospiraceae bacterium]
MLSICKHELKLNLKSLLIWSLSVGGLGFICLLMYTSMDGEMMDMADTFSNMGAFSDAFGMSTLSIATINGFFATEVGTVHGLGSALFAALLSTVLLSKEEDAHTGEFLFSLPLSRGNIVLAKLISLLIELTLFTLICGVMYILGFAVLKENISWNEMMIFLGSMLFMNIEISAIGLIVSACSARNRMGVGLGLALIFYSYDLIGRVVPDMKDYLFVGPFSYTNASEIFAGKEMPAEAMITAAAVTVIALFTSFAVYMKKDLA